MKRLMLVLATLALVGFFGGAAWAGDDDQGKGKGQGQSQGQDQGKGKGKGQDRGQGKRPDFESLFKRADANNDGKLSQDEFKKLPMFGGGKNAAKGESKGKGQGRGRDMADAIFKKLDTDNDGSISLDEFKKMAERRKKKDPVR